MRTTARAALGLLLAAMLAMDGWFVWGIMHAFIEDWSHSLENFAIIVGGIVGLFVLFIALSAFIQAVEWLARQAR